MKVTSIIIKHHILKHHIPEHRRSGRLPSSPLTADVAAGCGLRAVAAGSRGFMRINNKHIEKGGLEKRGKNNSYVSIVISRRHQTRHFRECATSCLRKDLRTGSISEGSGYYLFFSCLLLPWLD